LDWIGHFVVMSLHEHSIFIGMAINHIGNKGKTISKIAIKVIEVVKKYNLYSKFL
jgi:hypothetical protein